jgi:hypothetical protein
MRFVSFIPATPGSSGSRSEHAVRVVVIMVPEVVRQKAFAVGADAWLDDLPLLVTALEHEWSITVGAVVERVSTGLLCTRVGLQPVGRRMLAVADRVAESAAWL